MDMEEPRVSTAPIDHDRQLKWIPTEKIIQNNANPRKEPSFSADRLESLRRSISTHGILQPLIVTPYDEDVFLLVDGERRWRSAKIDGVKELPAIVVNRLSGHDEVVVMFNVHTQHEGWEMAEQLVAIKELKARNGHLSDDELARELGMQVVTFRDRLRVLDMGDQVVTEIAKGSIEYSAALRSTQTANIITRARPKLAAKLGGEKAVEQRLVEKAKTGGKGISQELVKYKADFADPERVPDDLVEEYVSNPAARVRDLLQSHPPIEERHRADELTHKLRRLELDIRTFSLDPAGGQNLTELRRALGALNEAAQALETKIVQALAASALKTRIARGVEAGAAIKNSGASN